MIQKLVLEKILEMSIVAILGLLVHGEEALVDPLLEVQGGLQGLQRRGPLHAAGLRDVLEITKNYSGSGVFSTFQAMWLPGTFYHAVDKKNLE